MLPTVNQIIMKIMIKLKNKESNDISNRLATVAF